MNGPWTMSEAEVLGFIAIVVLVATVGTWMSAAG
jgi:hypothetical protein